MTDIQSPLSVAPGDRDRVEREPGGGGVSRVFVATHSALSREVVVKVISVEHGYIADAWGMRVQKFVPEVMPDKPAS